MTTKDIDCLLDTYRTEISKLQTITSLHAYAKSSYLSGNIIKAKKIERLIYITRNSIVPYEADISPKVHFAYGGNNIVVHKIVQYQMVAPLVFQHYLEGGQALPA